MWYNTLIKTLLLTVRQKEKHMVFLDTNAFYYASQISNNEHVDDYKLREYIENNDISISSVSFFEFLVKFRNSIETIHKGADFLSKNEIKIVYNKYFPSRQEFDCNYCNITKDELAGVITKVIDMKVNTESAFASITYDLLLFSAFYFYYTPEGENASEIKKKIFEVCYRTWAENNLDAFRKVFEDGYKTDDCEKTVRDAVRSLLEYSLALSFSIFDGLREFENEEEFMNLLDNTDFMVLSQNKLKKIQKYDTSMVYISKLAKIYNDVSSDNNSLDYLSKLSEPIAKTIKEQGLREYLSEIVVKCCKHGSPFLKNDILDGIILCNIENDHSLITFDKAMKAHMEKYSEERPTYKSSIELIKNFEKATS